MKEILFFLTQCWALSKTFTMEKIHFYKIMIPRVACFMKYKTKILNSGVALNFGFFLNVKYLEHLAKLLLKLQILQTTFVFCSLRPTYDNSDAKKYNMLKMRPFHFYSFRFCLIFYCLILCLGDKTCMEKNTRSIS